MEIVSIIIPVYNLEKNIKYCLDSISAQTYQNLEVIIVNDGSTDNSSSICHKYERSDPRFHVYDKQNGGVSSARNYGLDNATGELIAFVDGDDIVPPYYIDRLVSAIEGNALSMCMHERISSYNDTLPDINEEFAQYRADDCAGKLLLSRFPVCVWGGILLRRIVGDLRFPVGIKNNEDKFFIYNYLLNAGTETIAFTNQKMYGYYVRPGSATKSEWNGRRDTIIIADEMHKTTMRVHPEWEDYSTFNRLLVRLNTLRDIAKSKDTYNKLKADFEQIKHEILSVDLPKCASRTVKAEYLTLKIGNTPFRLLVRVYYLIMSDRLRYKRNERASKQD